MSDSYIVQFKSDTAGEAEKRIMLPFMGFYDSKFDNRIYKHINDLAQEFYFDDEKIKRIASKIDYNAHFKVIADAYVRYLNQELSDILPKPINMTQADVHAQAPLATIAELASAVIDVTELPSVDFMADFCTKHKLLDFKKNLQVIANYELLSKDQNISNLFNKPYKDWQNVHIESLMSALVQVIQVNKTGVEQVNWKHDIFDFETNGFIPYAEEQNVLDIDIDF